VEPGSSCRHGQDGYLFKQETTPRAGEESLSRKSISFISTDLKVRLQAKKVREVVVYGVIANNSFDATVRIASNLGLSICTPDDASAAFE